MIVVTNTYLPTLKKLKTTGEQKPIANTGAGDVAYYTTRRREPTPYEDEEDEEDEI